MKQHRLVFQFKTQVSTSPHQPNLYITKHSFPLLSIISIELNKYKIIQFDLIQ